MEKNLTDSKKMANGNTIIHGMCTKLGLPIFTTMVAQGLFQKFFDLHSNLRRLCYTSIFLSSKITEHPISASLWLSATKTSVDTDLELKMARGLEFDFVVFDVYNFIEKIASTIELNRVKDGRREKLAEIFSGPKILSFAPFGTDFEFPSLGLALFSDDEISLFETISHIEVNREEIQKIRERVLMCD